MAVIIIEFLCYATALCTTVDGSNCWGVNLQRPYPPLKTKLKVIKNPHLQHQPQ